MIGQGWEIGYKNARGLETAKRRQIGDNVYLLDNTEQVQKQICESMRRAAMAVGREAVGMVRRQMIDAYHDPHPDRDPDGKPTGGTHTAIRDTSALINDVQFEIDGSGEKLSVLVGNTLRYALFVHDGTRFVRPRPYIRDAIAKGWARLMEVWAAYIRTDMD